jgi:hypothetical protein
MLNFSTFQLILCDSYSANLKQKRWNYWFLGCRWLLTQSPQCDSVELTWCNFKLCVSQYVVILKFHNFQTCVNLNWFAVDWWQKNCHCWREEDRLKNMDKSSRHFNGQCLYGLGDKDLVYVVSLSATQTCNNIGNIVSFRWAKQSACAYKHGTKNSPISSGN